MSSPSPDQVRVATQTLRDEAAVWYRQADALDQAAAQARALDMTHLEGGIFAPFITAYQQATAQITGRAGEGHHALAAVGDTLRQIADTYDREEATNQHRFRNLY